MTEQNYETAFNKLFNMYIPENQLSKRADTNWTEITGILNIKEKIFQRVTSLHIFTMIPRLTNTQY